MEEQTATNGVLVISNRRAAQIHSYILELGNSLLYSHAFKIVRRLQQQEGYNDTCSNSTSSQMFSLFNAYCRRVILPLVRKSACR